MGIKGRLVIGITLSTGVFAICEYVGTQTSTAIIASVIGFLGIFLYRTR